MVSEQDIRYDFVKYGAIAPADLEGKNTVYLDVGNGLRVGVIDQHQLASYRGASAQLVTENISFVLDALSAEREAGELFRIIVHEKPDFDCLVSAWITKRLILDNALPSGISDLLAYTSEIDIGRMGATKENPLSIYSAYMTLSNRLGKRRWNSPKDLYRRQISQGLEILDYAHQTMIQKELSPLDVNGFLTPGLFSSIDERQVTSDIERYESKLQETSTKARSTSLKLSGTLGGRREVSALFVRNVQNIDDPERVIHFKDWARDDITRGGPDGFVFLSVFSNDQSNGERGRCIISVQPDKRVSLRGLGVLLEQAECAKRHTLYGDDDRLHNVKGEALPLRPGYMNPDPWYDGRGHNYSIVDSPRSKSVLTADEIESIIMAFAEEGKGSFKSLSEIVKDETLPNDAKLNLLSEIARNNATPKPPKPGRQNIFISYARKDVMWVKENIYTPLVKEYGKEAIFLDEQSLEGGTDWLVTLSNAIQTAELFIPIYSQNFFNSTFCIWELQLALIKDPTGSNGKILPVLYTKTELPLWCSLIQAQDPSKNQIVKMTKSRISLDRVD